MDKVLFVQNKLKDECPTLPEKTQARLQSKNT